MLLGSFLSLFVVPAAYRALAPKQLSAAQADDGVPAPGRAAGVV
jgi:hypothetical protein